MAGARAPRRHTVAAALACAFNPKVTDYCLHAVPVSSIALRPVTFLYVTSPIETNRGDLQASIVRIIFPFYFNKVSRDELHKFIWCFR